MTSEDPDTGKGTTVYGIDLGTTYSCIAKVDPETNRAEVLRNRDNEVSTPSVVLFDPPTDSLVGKFAKAEAVLYADRVVQLFKRQMKDPDWLFTITDPSWDGPAEWTAPQISALVLRKLANDVKETTGETVKSVVITIPAYFGSVEREATRLAGKLADLEVVSIINEPTAAAISYGLGSDGVGKDESVLVYDLGGGTFDISVIRIEGGDVTVVVVDGDHELGGTDWDSRIQEYIADRFVEECPEAGDPMDDPDSEQELANQAERIKQELTERKSAKALIQYGGSRASIEITKEKLNEISADLVSRTIDKTRSALATSEEKGGASIGKILLVGGSSKMPMIREALESAFDFPVEMGDPDLAVAKGAALYGRICGQVIEEPDDPHGPPGPQGKVKDVCTQGFGLKVLRSKEAEETYIDFALHRNDRVPAKIERTYFTVMDDQTAVEMSIYEQVGDEENEDPTANKLILSPAITGIPTGSPAGTRIVTTITMSRDGTLRMIAQHEGHDVPLEVELNVPGAVTGEQLKEQKQKVAAIAGQP